MALQYFCNIIIRVIRFCLFLFIFQAFFIGPALSQEPEDTTNSLAVDSIRKRPVSIPPPLSPLADSFSRKPYEEPKKWIPKPGLALPHQIMEDHPYFEFSGEAVVGIPKLRRYEGKELLFYTLVGVLLMFAFLKQAFAKYFNDLFRLFFRTTLKYRQIREQLMQTPLPSLLLNAFFVISAGLYITFLLEYFELIERKDFWKFYLYSCLGLIAIYFVKFLGLKIIGWIFNLQDAADSYIFIVFVINKVIGVFLLPFNIVLAFIGEGPGYYFALVLSWFGIGALILYRFILSYAAVRNQVRFNPFHFFLYICAFEIAPLLLIYKLLLVFFQ